MPSDQVIQALAKYEYARVTYGADHPLTIGLKANYDLVRALDSSGQPNQATHNYTYGGLALAAVALVLLVSRR